MKKRYETKVTVFLILTRNENGKMQVLLQERCNTGYMDGMYDTACSGHLESGESMAMAVIREAKEEINIEINPKELELVTVFHPYKEDYMNVFFTAKKYTGIPEIMEKEKCSNLSWFDIDCLPDNTIERVKKVLNNMQNGIVYDDDEIECGIRN